MLGERIEYRLAAATEKIALGPSLGQCCGGAVRLLYERIDGERRVTVSANCGPDPARPARSPARERPTATLDHRPSRHRRPAATGRARRRRHAVGPAAPPARSHPRLADRARRRAAGRASISTAPVMSGARSSPLPPPCRSRSFGSTPPAIGSPRRLPATSSTEIAADPAHGRWQGGGQLLSSRHDLLACHRPRHLPRPAAAQRLRLPRPHRLEDEAGAVPVAAAAGRHRGRGAPPPHLARSASAVSPARSPRPSRLRPSRSCCS